MRLACASRRPREREREGCRGVGGMLSVVSRVASYRTASRGKREKFTLVEYRGRRKRGKSSQPTPDLQEE